MDRRFAENQTGKRKVVVIIRERNGNSLPAVFGTEGAASASSSRRIAKGTIVNADEAASWDGLHARFEMKRINHQEAYSIDGACTNWAEEYFSRLRRGEIGTITISQALICSATLKRRHGAKITAASQWRTGRPRCRAGDEAQAVVDFCGYWQRHIDHASSAEGTCACRKSKIRASSQPATLR